ncbi:MAG: cupin domain-containing protein [Clostridia bacterium]|nr:cupin domain-containing protein [Clostridia bacterium]
MVRKRDEAEIKINPHMRGGDGTVTVRSLLRKEADEFYGKGRLFAEIDIPAGASIGKHLHEGEMETFYVLAGKGLFDDNGALTEVGEGDVCYTASGEEHAIRNVGEDELRLMALILYR